VWGDVAQVVTVQRGLKGCEGRRRPATR
jgi:hypothetical protein